MKGLLRTGRRVHNVGHVIANEILFFLGKFSLNILNIFFVDVKHVKAVVAVLGEIFLLATLPNLREVSNCVECKLSFFLGETSILA